MNTEDIKEITRKLEAGDYDEELTAYSKTAEFKYYNQPYFNQWKLTDNGMEYEENGAVLEPRESFSDD